MRLQSSWIMETVSDLGNVKDVFFPYVKRFSNLSWFKTREIPMRINNPLDSQAILLKSFVDSMSGEFQDRNRKKFNQIIKKPLELEMNPFQKWNDVYFSRRQLDYLFYWREAAYEIECKNQRDIFWSSVYNIISYWLSNRLRKVEVAVEPDEIMDMVLNRQKELVEDKYNEIKISNTNFEELVAEDCSLAVFPLIFKKEEGEEDFIQTIFHAWFHGHANCDRAATEIKNSVKNYAYSLDGKNDLSSYLKLAEKSRIVAVTWSGGGMAPALHEQFVVEPFKQAFSNLYQKTRFSIKTVDLSKDEFDFLLVFFN